MDPPDLSIVVPAFNEAERLPETIATLLGLLDARAGRSQLVVVDDGSSDATAALAADLLGDRSDCSLVALGRHRGKGAAVRAGILVSSCDRVVFMDADLATDLEDLDRVLAALDHADVVLGSRRVQGSRVEGQTLTAALAHRGFAGLARLVTGVPVEDFQCGFKAFRAPVAKVVFEQVREPGYAFDVEVLLVVHRMGLRIVEVPVRWRAMGGSHIRLVADSVSMLVSLARIRWRVGSARRGRWARSRRAPR
ncbi:MAG: glycosyltransferase [Microthrixaceae bacterium]|nr:glycosyltransferase [Microthrixaceae bacterium]MCO5318271.1 glycosyltransferase [Microthrixaceae bacterium]